MLSSITIPTSKCSPCSFSKIITKSLLVTTYFLSCFNPSSTLAQNKYEILELEQQIVNYELEIDNLSTEMAAYMMFHPKASAALIAAGGGAAAIIVENLSGAEKTILLGMGLLGLNHCRQSENSNRCAEVGTEITSYVSKINYYDKQINLLNEKINSFQDYSINSSPNYPSNTSWIPGTPHPEIANLVAGDTEGKWKPADGYRWVNREDVNDLSVIPISIIGVGISFKIDERYNMPLIVGVYSDSPADNIGLYQGIYITKIDGVLTQGKTSSQIAELLRGNKGTSVFIEYQDFVNDLSDTVQIVRDEFRT